MMGRKFIPRPVCAICGKTCKTLGRTFCSYQCLGIFQRGSMRPDAVGNKWAYRGERATVWAHYKRMQRLIPSGRCVVCGSRKQSVIHHVDHNPKNTVPENLVRMCRSCHARHHHPRANYENLNLKGTRNG